MGLLLEVENINMRFGGVKALDSVSLNIKDNEIKGLIGPNGSGKTTLFNVITGYYKPTSGNVIFNNERITGKRPFLIARKGISRTFQQTLLYNELTVLENLLIATYCNHNIFYSPIMPAKFLRKKDEEYEKLAEELLAEVGLYECKDDYVKNLPFGYRHFIEIARCLAMRPKLILLDEPTTGLNTAETEQMMVLIKRIKERGVTILIVEHNMRVIMNICEDITVLDMGIKIAEGNPIEIKSNKKVIESYLGKEELHA